MTSSNTTINNAFEAPAIGWSEDRVDDNGRWLKPEYSLEQQIKLDCGKYGKCVPKVVLDAVKQGRLVPFVGAGTSCIPPTALPSWTNVNQAVLKGLWGRALEAATDNEELKSYVHRFYTCIKETLEEKELPPEFFSEIIVNRLGDFYFNVLSVLDSDNTNTVHQTLASLAKVGSVRVIITTNFDTCVEQALIDEGVQPIVFKGQATFDVNALRIGLRETPFDASSPVCYVLKVHGSADDSSSVVDTLAQRSIGLPKEITDCVDLSLEYGHWLFLGFSGADLLGDKNYLQIRPSMDTAVGFTWLNRYCDQPLESVTKLANDYPNGKASILYAELPDALKPLNEYIDDCLNGGSSMSKNDSDGSGGGGRDARKRGPSLDRKHLSLEERVQQWANRLIPEEALVVLIDLSLNTTPKKQLGNQSVKAKNLTLKQKSEAMSISDCVESSVNIVWNQTTACIVNQFKTLKNSTSTTTLNVLDAILHASNDDDNNFTDESTVRNVNALCWLSEILCDRQDIQYRFDNAEKYTNIVLNFVDKCNKFNPMKNKRNDIDQLESKNENGGNGETKDPDKKPSLKTHSSHGHDSLNDIGKRLVFLIYSNICIFSRISPLFFDKLFFLSCIYRFPNNNMVAYARIES